MRFFRETTTDDEGEVDQGKEKEVRGPPRIEVKRASEDTGTIEYGEPFNRHFL